MVNLDDPKEFFRVIVDPNLREFYADEGDLRLGVNSILTLDALVGVLHQENRRKSGADPNDKDEKFRDDLATKSDAYRIVRDAAAAVKHGALIRPKQRMVLQVRDLADFGVGAGTMRLGEDWPGKPVVFVVTTVGRAVRLSGVLRKAAGYIYIAANGPPMSDVAFRQLVLAKWLTPAQAAKKYGCSDRTVRLWLAKWGYVEGQNVAIAYRSAEGHYDRLAALAADLVRQRVNIIVATGGSGLTGISLLALDIGSKRVGLLRELIPNATTIALLLNPKSPDVGQHSRARPLPHHL
jgi:hypothetical protein